MYCMFVLGLGRRWGGFYMEERFGGLDDLEKLWRYFKTDSGS